MKKKLFLFLFFAFIGKANAQFTKLLDFSGATNGSAPRGSLISDGTFLYGMTVNSGSNYNGTIFKIMPNGTGYVKLLDFDTINGLQPIGSLISDGTFLYGVTLKGGANYDGVIFKIMPDGTGYVKLYDFSNSTGYNPSGDLLYDGTYLYGMTEQGGSGNYGIIFKIKPNGTNYDTLVNFYGANGAHPYGSLISDNTYLYGMTEQGGSLGYGNIFKIKPDGSGFDTLYSFQNTPDGSTPYGNLFFDGTFLYGMTFDGGTYGLGTIFKIKTDGTGYSKLLDFAGSINGSNPYGSLISDGVFLYGMAGVGGGGSNGSGVIFKIMPNGTGYSKLFDFTSVTDGSYPYGSLLISNGCIFGMTNYGGANNDGTLFSLCGTLDIEGMERTDNHINIYPNPTTGTFNLKMSEFDDLKFDQLVIENAIGSVVYSASYQTIRSSNYQINASILDNGVYNLSIKNNSGIINKKLIIVK